MPSPTTRKGYYTAWRDGQKVTRPGHSGNHTSFIEARETVDEHSEVNGNGTYTIKQPDYEIDVRLRSAPEQPDSVNEQPDPGHANEPDSGHSPVSHTEPANDHTEGHNETDEGTDVSLIMLGPSVGGGQATPGGGGTELANWTFSDNAKPAAAYAGSQNGGSIGYSNGFVRASYPAPSDAVYAWFGLDVASENIDNIYLDFDARMPGNVNGFKFVKVFGKTNAGAYSNCTFGLEYGTGVMAAVSFGDGSTSQNDTQQILKYDGNDPSFVGRSYNNGAVLSTPQNASFSGWSDNDWHNFKLGVQFNSGTSAANEVNDGTFYVEIDGDVYCDSSGLFNRYWGASDIEKVELFGYASNGSSFDMDYDNIVISKDGFM